MSAGGYTSLSEEGMLELPYRVVNVLLPQGETVESVRVRGERGRAAWPKGSRCARSGAMLSEDGKAGRGPAMAGCGAEGVYPEEAGRYLGTGYLHGRGIASFAVFPVRVDGTGLVLTERVTVEVDDEGDRWRRPVVRERYREGFEERLRETLEGLRGEPGDGGGYRYGAGAGGEEAGGLSADVVIRRSRGARWTM